MNGATTTFTIKSGIVNSNSGLENIAVVPSDLAAIAKAISGSYLASEGNAFSTRVASQIVQEHFNPHEWNIYLFHFSDGDNWSGNDTEE